MSVGVLTWLVANQDRILADRRAWEGAVHAGLIRVQTLNLHHVRLFANDPSFRAATLAADRWTADGWPVRLALRILGVRVARVTGRRLCADLVSDSGFLIHTRRVAILGGSNAVGHEYATLLDGIGRETVYREHGDKREWQLRAVAHAVRAARADLLLIAVTPPDGDVIASQIRAVLEGSACLVVAVGGAIDMAVGVQRAAPEVVGDFGFEWLWRLAHDPGRLAGRYLRDGIATLLVMLPREIAAAVAHRKSIGAAAVTEDPV